MNTITERMVKLKAACLPNNNIKFKNKFSSFFHAAAALLLLIGNSSFTSTSKGQSFKKNSLEMTALISNGDEINMVKIAKPSLKMIIKADREIHMNMNSLITELNAFRIGSFADANTDASINDQFYSAFHMEYSIKTFEWVDQRMQNYFEAENIKLNLSNYALSSDNQIFKEFYLIGYIYSDPALLTEADYMISDHFHTENL